MTLLDDLRYPIRPMHAAELHHVMSCARRATLTHRLFNTVEFEFVVNRCGEIALAMRARVLDRDAPPTYDSDIRGDVAYDRDPWRQPFGEEYANARIPLPERRLLPFIWVSIERPVRIDPDHLDPAHSEALTTHLVRELRSHLIWFMTHELDEMLRVDGRLASDPHGMRARLGEGP